MNERIEKVKKHVKDHQMRYSCIVTGVIVAGITVIIMRDRHAVLQTGADGPDMATMRSLSFNFFSRQSESGNVTTVIFREGRGHPGYITRWLEEMIDYETQGLAASEHEVKPSVMSAHIQGRIPDIDGKHFVRVAA